MGFYFRSAIPTSFSEVSECDAGLFTEFFHAMLDKGIYLAPSAFEAGFISASHDDQVIRETLDAAEQAFDSLARRNAPRG
jgi:glutamate-1-semialdehyde 2,1-aminomutase